MNTISTFQGLSNMCGVCGIILRSDNSNLMSTIRLMTDCLSHRGPNDEGVWIDQVGGVALGHRRLSILDLSSAGAQPMASVCGRKVLVFNGEVYNHLSMRQALEAEKGKIDWRGHSDTETLLEGILHWGLVKTLRKAIGMFALALWDTEAEVLELARDRLGEKPLYIASLEDGLAFASELPALLIASSLEFEVDVGALESYISTGTVPDEACILKNMRKVRPGSILRIKNDKFEEVEVVYESFEDILRCGRSQMHMSDSNVRAVDRVERVLVDVVSSQMISDVPIGCFLSGGVDSSLIASLMRDCATKPIKTFSVGFSDVGYDESFHAERIAEHLGTDHKSFNLREEDALDIIPNLVRVYGEPFADSSQIPTLLLCLNARKDVTVALTGDGGDEIFGGYNRYVFAPKLWSHLSRLPRLLRQPSGMIGRTIERMGGERSRTLRACARKANLPASVLDKAARIGQIAGGVSSLEGLYSALKQHTDDPSTLVVKSISGSRQADLPIIRDLSPEEWMMSMDTLTYLPSDVLVKVDRAAMSVSLETRAPFLDRRVVETAWSLPIEERIANGEGKRVLREILNSRVPICLMERPKQGFAVPIDKWLRGPLRSWADDILSRDRIEKYGFLNCDSISKIWADHKNSRSNQGSVLWSVIMFQAWLDEYWPR